MRGAKPRLDNVTPMRGSANAENERMMRSRAKATADKLRPRGITKSEFKEWNRVAPMLADPRIDRLKAHFVDAALELCRVNLRLRGFRDYFAKNKIDLAADVPGNHAMRVTGEAGLDAEMYVVEGRNGIQLKSHPFVAQMNETWRQWRSLISMFGLNPTDERNMMPGQGGLFDDPANEFYGG